MILICQLLQESSINSISAFSDLKSWKEDSSSSNTQIPCICVGISLFSSLETSDSDEVIYIIFMMLLSKKEVWTSQKNNYHPFLLVSPNYWLHLGTFLDSVTGVPQGKMQPFPGSTRFSGNIILCHMMKSSMIDSSWFGVVRFLQQKRTSAVRKVLIIPRNPTFFTPFCGSFPIHIPQWTRRIFATRHLFQSQSTWVVTQEIWGQFEGTTEKNWNCN